MATRDRWLIVEENDDLWLIKREGSEVRGRIVSREGFAGNFLASMINWWRRTTRMRGLLPVSWTPRKGV